MDDQIIIPGRGQESFQVGRKSFGIFMVLGFLILAVSIAALVGILLYKQFLADGVQAAKTELRDLEAGFDQAQIEEWTSTARSIDLAKETLKNHAYISNIFSFLERNTLPDVRFTTFSFDSNSNTVRLGAQAKSYAALAQQKGILEADPVIENLAIGNFRLTPKGGVDFDLEVTFNSSIFSQR